MIGHVRPSDVTVTVRQSETARRQAAQTRAPCAYSSLPPDRSWKYRVFQPAKWPPCFWSHPEYLHEVIGDEVRPTCRAGGRRELSSERGQQARLAAQRAACATQLRHTHKTVESPGGGGRWRSEPSSLSASMATRPPTTLSAVSKINRVVTQR